MKKVLVGHRGVGKSDLLNRHAIYFPQISHFDLDKEIEFNTTCSISEYFKKHSEADFRKLEIKIFQKLTNENSDYVIALGAGFDISVLPNDIEVIFIRRLTDKDGRIFLHRPRLEPLLSPLDEYQKRYKFRHNKFLLGADGIYDMPEGVTAANAIEKMILTDRFLVQDAYYTLCVQDLGSIGSLINNYKNIELRTDLLSSEVIQGLLNSFPEHQWLVSIRSSDPMTFKNAKNIDADIKYYYSGCQALSSHAEQIETGIQQLSEFTGKIHLKLCPVVEYFSDLIKGYNWQQADAENRSFLPRSVTGKWVWYRQYSKYLQKINFVRNFTEGPDQPSLSEWLILPNEKPKAWAALLGGNIHFSRSPGIHQNYFSERNSFFSAISVTVAELEYNLKFLTELGLKYAAITSPLKETSFNLAHAKSEISEQLKSANSFFIEKGEVICHNTDLAGFKELVKDIKSDDKVAVWGGGGTLSMMKDVLPWAHFFSSQTGELRKPGENGHKSYDYLIWAAPRTTQIVWPDDKLAIGTVIDLNYTENSLGLEFAALRKTRYISGLEMLKLQALKQQEFWSQNECK